MLPAFTSSEIRKAIFDFYILSKGIPSEFQDDGRLRNYRTDLLNRWRRTLLRDIEYCLACELRHLFDGTAKAYPHGTTWEDWFKKHFQDIGVAWRGKYRALFAQGQAVPSTGDPEFDEAVSTIMKAHGVAVSAKKGKRMRSYLAAKGAEAMHGLSLIEVSERAFDPKYVHWNHAYGGAKWNNVAATMHALLYTTDATEIVHLIDTAFALQHNTAIVFNKNALWAGPNNYVWLMEALDYKWVAISPQALLGFASEGMQEMVRALGFRCAREVPPGNMHFRPMMGATLRINLEGQVIDLKIKTVAGAFYRSVAVASPTFKMHKQSGKYAKELDTRVFLWEDLAARAQGWIVEGTKTHTKPSSTAGTPPLMVDKDKFGDLNDALKAGLEKLKKTKTVNPLLAKYKTDQSFLAFKAALSAAYESFEGHVSALGYSLGSFLEKGYTIRFRVVGAPKPCRFYFVFDAGAKTVDMHVGKTEEQDLFSANKVSTFSKPDSGAILARLEKHLSLTLEG